MDERPDDATEGIGAAPPPPTEPPPVPPGPAARPPIPWEDPGRPRLGAFFETLKLLFMRPREAFERMPISGDVLRPFLFALITGWLGVLFQCVWELSTRDLMRSMAPSPDAWKGVYDLPVGAWPFIAALGPFFIAVGVLISTVTYHVALLLTGAGKRGFAATLRVICYAQAGTVLAIVPFCGSVVAGIWTIVLTILGLSVAHRITVGRAAVAVLLPVALCCVCATILIFTFSAALKAMFVP